MWITKMAAAATQLLLYNIKMHNNGHFLSNQDQTVVEENRFKNIEI